MSTRARVGRRWLRRARGELLRSGAVSCVVLLTAACSKEFEESACPAASCEGQGPSCRSYDFVGPTCPTELAFGGDTSLPNVAGECQSGKLHVSADDTLDIVARLGLEAPDTEYAIEISARIAIVDWDGGPALRLNVGSEAAFDLRAGVTPSGNVRYELCASSTCGGSFETLPGKEHRFDFDVGSSGTQASVDCEAFASTPAGALPTSTLLELLFGKTDAQPIDGTLDDVVVAFR